MMQKLLCACLLVLGAQAAFAAKRLTVAEFEGQLQHLRGKSDDYVTYRLNSLALTERVTPARLAQWLVKFPGKHESLALIAMADSAAFMSLPVADIASTDLPTIEERQAILTRAVEFLRNTVHLLPDFYATRDTLQFDDSLDDQRGVFSMGGDDVLTMPAQERTTHLVGKHSLKVSYVHGAETLNDQDPARVKHGGGGLTTWGEFGPILSVIFGDIKSSALTWKCWEQDGNEKLAVFHYSVAHEKSHYLVAIRPRIEPQYPAYQGEISIDPATGTISRVTMLAELGSKGPATSANIAVEYGPVTLGDRVYNCPMHGVAISQDINVDNAGNGLTQINDVHFVNYHLFRGDVRILPETP